MTEIEDAILQSANYWHPWPLTLEDLDHWDWCLAVGLWETMAWLEEDLDLDEWNHLGGVGDD